MPKRDNPRTGPKYEKKEAPARRGRTAASGRGDAPRQTRTARAAQSVGPKPAAKAEENPNLLIGRNPVTEAIKARRCWRCCCRQPRT